MKRQMFMLLPIFVMMSANTPLPEGINSNFRYLPTGFKSDIPRTNANFDSFKGSKRQKSLSSRANRRKASR